jgi:hypothetical protein
MEEEGGTVFEKDDKTGKEEIFTKVVRAGKRTYFFDVKATRREDYYLTITESKKRIGKEGKAFYEKHKIFLYKEDFDKFTDGLRDAVEYIGNGRDLISHTPAIGLDTDEKAEVPATVEREFTNVDFEDLGKE